MPFVPDSLFVTPRSGGGPVDDPENPGACLAEHDAAIHPCAAGPPAAGGPDPGSAAAGRDPEGKGATEAADDPAAAPQLEIADINRQYGPSFLERYLSELYGRDWVVYAKPAANGPEAALKYLARYTYRVAIAHSHLELLVSGRVTFRYRDYTQNGRWRSFTLDAHEFLRRFLLHVLPKGLMRLRSFGFLASRHRALRLARCRELLAAAGRDNVRIRPPAKFPAPATEPLSNGTATLSSLRPR